MTPYKTLYGQKYRLPIECFEEGKSMLIRPNLVQQTMEKVKLIREQLLMAQSRQRLYSDVRQKDLKFGVNDRIFLILEFELRRMLDISEEFRK